MNVRTIIPRREPVKLTVPSFLLLGKRGAFSDYVQPELIDGKIVGISREDDAEGSDARQPIKIGAEDYGAISRAGAFDDLGKTELVDGLVYAMSPQYRRHGFAKDELAYRLRRALEAMASPLHVATEQSVNLGPFSEPQPDIVLTSQPRGAGPIPRDSVALIAEVSDSTVNFDLDKKMQVYALAGIAEYWVVDVNDGAIHRMSQPDRDRYVEHDAIVLGAPLTARTIPALSIATDSL